MFSPLVDLGLFLYKNFDHFLPMFAQQSHQIVKIIIKEKSPVSSTYLIEVIF